MTNLSALQSGSDSAVPTGREQTSSQEARRRQLEGDLAHGLTNVSGWLDTRSARPDVSIGVSQHIFQPASALRPFAISPNKLYLARSHCHGRYRAVLRDRARRYYLKTSEMYGYEVDVYGYDRSSSWRRRVINYVKKSPIGGPAQALYQRYRTRTRRDPAVGSKG